MFKRILVPLDGSELSESIMPQAMAIAELSRAELILFRVLEPLEKEIRETMGEEWAQKLDTVNNEDAESYLKNVGKNLVEKGVKVKIVTAFGRPADAITEYAETHNVDLITMATHGRSGLSRLAFGSVADKVLRQSTVPVLLSPVGLPRGA